MPGIGSEAVGGGNSVGATFNSLPQLAAENEGGTDAEQRQGAGDGDRRKFCCNRISLTCCARGTTPCIGVEARDGGGLGAVLGVPKDSSNKLAGQIQISSTNNSITKKALNCKGKINRKAPIPIPRHHPAVSLRVEFHRVQWVLGWSSERGHVVLNTINRHHKGLGRARAEADGRQDRSSAKDALD